MRFKKEYDFINYIPGSENFISADIVHGGWSEDLKFKIVTNDGSNYLLRCCDISQKDKKEKEFEILTSLNSLNISFSIPIEFGVILEHKKVYMLLAWMDGDNVEVMMSKLNREEQYECGLKAGKILKKLHSISSSDSVENWKNKNLSKLKERIKIYEDFNDYEIKHFDVLVEYIYNNLDLLDNRPMTFLHGDFQGRNIVVDKNCNVGAIDFERTTYGDPFEEFNRMMTYTRRWSTDFCNGQVDGYFEGNEPPERFWEIVAFHCALNLLTTIIFGVSTNQKHIYQENEEAKNIIFDDFNGFTTFIPSWYLNRS